MLRGLCVNDADTAAPAITAWQCIGCGRLDGPRPCIGVCQDRKVSLVHAEVHERALADLAAMRRERDACAAFARMVATARPHEGQWQRSYEALQQRALALLGGPVPAAAEAPGA